MKKQDKHEPNNQQPIIEDLTINQDQAEEVKGGDDRVDASVGGYTLWRTNFGRSS